jgi:hypothetical protein
MHHCIKSVFKTTDRELGDRPVNEIILDGQVHYLLLKESLKSSSLQLQKPSLEKLAVLLLKCEF